MNYLAILLFSIKGLLLGYFNAHQIDQTVKVDAFVGKTKYSKRLVVSEGDTIYIYVSKYNTPKSNFTIKNEDKAVLSSWNRKSEYEDNADKIKIKSRAIYSSSANANQFSLKIYSKPYDKKLDKSIFYLPVREVVEHLRKNDDCFSVLLPDVYNGLSELAIHPRDKRFEFIIRH